MGTPQKEHLRELAETERSALQRIVRASSERVDRVRRARALLTVAAGTTFAAAAREAGLHTGTTVANLVARFNRQGVAALSIAAGRGRKPTYDASARAQIVATAQTGRPGSQEGRDGHLVALHPPEAAPEGRDWSGLAPTPSNACWRMPAARTRRPGVGVRRGRPSGCARVGWSP